MGGSKTGGNEGGLGAQTLFLENQEAPDRDYTVLPQAAAD